MMLTHEVGLLVTQPCRCNFQKDNVNMNEHETFEQLTVL